MSLLSPVKKGTILRIFNLEILIHFPYWIVNEPSRVKYWHVQPWARLYFLSSSSARSKNFELKFDSVIKYSINS